MDIAVGERWERFLSEVVSEGRYASASEVVLEGLRLVELRERKLQDLRATVQASIAEGGSYTSEEVFGALEERLSELAKQGF